MERRQAAMILLDDWGPSCRAHLSGGNSGRGSARYTGVLVSRCSLAWRGKGAV